MGPGSDSGAATTPVRQAPAATRVVALAIALALAAVAVIVAASWRDPVDWLAVLLFAGGFVVLQFLPVPVPRRSDVELVHIDEALLVPLVLLQPPLEAVLAVAVGVAAGQALVRTTPLRLAFNVAQMVLGTAACGAIVLLVAGAAPGPTPEGVAAAVAGMIAFFTINHVLISAVLAAATGAPMRRLLADDIELQLLMWVSNVVAGLLFAVVARAAPWLFVVMPVPLLALNRVHRTHVAAVREREQNERLRGDFVATVSHELRTPLTTVKGMVETMRSSDIELSAQMQAQFLEIMSGQVDRLERLVQALLDTQQLSGGVALVGELGPVDVQGVVERCVGDFRLAHPEADVRVEASGPAFAHADGARLEQVVANLVDNAFRHGDATAPIRIHVEATASGVQVAVSDEGDGIPDAEQDRIFDRFYVPESSASRHGGGVGLGLYLSRRITEQMGGMLRVDSRPGAGSTFTISLRPAAPRVT